MSLLWVAALKYVAKQKVLAVLATGQAASHITRDINFCNFILSIVSVVYLYIGSCSKEENNKKRAENF